MRLARASMLAATIVAACGCGSETAEPRGQWKVFLHTDAPIPQFGDRLAIEVEADGDSSCGACRRQLGTPDASHWPISFGVAPRAGAELTVLRVRLYRSRHVAADGGPPDTALIDVLAALPNDPVGVTEVHVLLGMECFGKSADPVARTSCDPSTGAMAPLGVLDSAPIAVEPGSWPPAATVPCPQAAPEGMRCIEGGAFLLGEVTGPRVEPRVDGVPERLVRVSPFALDRTEVTVGEVLELSAEGKLTQLPTAKSSDNTSSAYACTFRDDPAAFDLPVNCVTRDLASAICEAQGKRLPTEAEWEFAASGRTNESPYPWGDDRAVCEHARVAWGLKSPFTAQPEDVTCAGALGQTEHGPTAEGHALDVTPHGITNMAGNIGEWVADDHALYTDACWQPELHLLFDPICSVGATAGKLSRGASYADSPFVAPVQLRRPKSSGIGEATPYVGVRCAASL